MSPRPKTVTGKSGFKRAVLVVLVATTVMLLTGCPETSLLTAVKQDVEAAAVKPEQVATPVFTPTPGLYQVDLAVDIVCGTVNATIYYTITDGTNGTPPSSSSLVYAAPIAIAGNGTVKTLVAVAMKEGMQSSQIAAATYTINYGSYLLSFDGNGSNGGSPPSSTAYLAGDLVVAPSSASLTRTGYSFNGWNEAANGSGASHFAGTTFTMPASNLTLYAQWTINQYTVTYDANGGAGTPPAGGGYNYNSTVTVAGQGSLTRTGYTFSGWNETSTGAGTAHAAGSTFAMPALNLTLYAQWSVNQYTVTYDGNGGTGTPPTGGSYAYNSVVLAQGQGGLTRTGYSFTGWNEAANGTGTTHLAGITFTMPASNLTLYAQWTINSYTVTYNANGGTGTPPTGGSYSYAAMVVVAGQGSLTRTGYTFNGWNEASGGTGAAHGAGSTFPMPATNLTLYAQWSVNQYTVTYSANGGTGTPPTGGSYDYNSTVTVAGQGSLTRTGYTFSGWNEASGGTGTAHAAGSTFSMPASNLTLYAQWSPNQYTVTYNANGGTGTPPTGGSYAYNSTVIVQGQGSLTRTGYTFNGWNEASGGTGTAHAAGSTFNMPASNLTLYAQWTINSYSVTYNANGGTGTPPTGGSYAYNSTVIVQGQGSLTRTGHTFSGWNEASGGTGAAHAAGSTFSMPASNLTLYAQWTINSYSVTYNANGGTGTPPTGGSYAYNSTVTVAGQGSLTQTGYIFNGWNEAANGSGSQHAAGSTFSMPASNLTLYAQWAVQQCTLTLLSEDTTQTKLQLETASGQTFPYGTTVPISCKIIQSGLGNHFDNWTLESGSATIATATARSTTVTLTGNATVKCWYSGGVILTTSSHGGVTPYQQTVNMGVKYAITTDSVYTAGGFWTFDHWASTVPDAVSATFDSATSNSTNVTVLKTDDAGCITIKAFYNGPL